MTDTNAPKKQGFAALPRERMLEIARAGQAAVRASGNRRKFTSEQARAASKLAQEAKARKRAAATQQTHQQAV